MKFSLVFDEKIDGAVIDRAVQGQPGWNETILEIEAEECTSDVEAAADDPLISK